MEVWLVEDKIVFPVARFLRAPIWCPSAGDGTREAGGTVAESLVALYRVSAHQIRRDWRAARSSTSHGSAEPLCARIKGANREVSEGKLMSDHGLFSSYEGQQGAANRQNSGVGFQRHAQALDGWMLARAPGSPAQGLNHHGSRYFNFPYFVRDVWP